jgi:hypothetical protein
MMRKKSNASVASIEKDRFIEPVPFGMLFRFATPSDLVLTYLSAFLGVLCGCVPPCLSLLLGNMMNSLNLNDKASFEAAVSQVATYMLILGCVAFTLSYIYMTCGLISAERQAIRLRKEYFKALLRQVRRQIACAAFLLIIVKNVLLSRSCSRGDFPRFAILIWDFSFHFN